MTTETQFNNIVNIMTKYQNNSIRIYYDDNITEENIMSALFSNTLIIDENAKKYFLKYQYTNVYENILQKTKFYALDFTIIEPDSTKKNIYDIDISYYNKQNVMKYYVLIDLLSELYGYLSTKDLSSKTITIKSRYVIEGNEIVLYKKSDYYTFDIHYTYDSISGISKYAIINVQNKDMIDMVVNMYDIYKNDILRHLNYINKNDITNSTKEYLYNIHTFYKFCRLKLIYYTLACCAKINKNVDDFILQYLSFSFLNLKSSIVLKNIDNKSLELSNQFLITSDKLDILNEKIYKSQNKIKKNYNIQKQLNSDFIKYIFWTIVIIAIVISIGTYILYHSNSFNPRGIMDILIITIIIIIYVICHYIMKINIKENFEILSKLPNPSATSNSYNTIKITGSTKQSGTDYWYAFDNNNNTSWNTAINTYIDGNASTTFRSDYKGEYIMIDLGKSYTLKKYEVLSNDINKSPSNFRLYVSNNPNSFNNINDSGWNMIHSILSHQDYRMDSKYQKEYILSNNYNKNSIIKIVCAPYHTVYLENTGKVLAIGFNHGSTPVGITGVRPWPWYDRIFTPEYVLAPNGGKMTGIVNIVCSMYHTLFLENTGKVLACGNNNVDGYGSGITGTTTTNTLGKEWDYPGAVYVPQYVLAPNGKDLMTGIVKIVCSNMHTVFLETTGRVLACGKNDGHGITGTSNTSGTVYVPQYVLKTTDGRATTNGGATTYGGATQMTGIVNIVCSNNHTVFLENTGKVLACGLNRNSSGLTGTTTTHTDIVYVPQYVLGPGGLGTQITGIVNIVCSTDHTVFLENTGKVLACGGNYAYEHGITGTQNTAGTVYVPQYVLKTTDGGATTSQMTGIVNIECSAFNTVFLENTGKVLACGANEWPANNSRGITGTRITRISYDKVFIPEYVFKRTDGGTINTQMTGIVKIACSGYITMFLENTGKVLACGANGATYHGSSITGTRSTAGIVYVPEYVLAPGGTSQMTGIIDISCALWSTVFLENTGRALACGYNNNGGITGSRTQNVPNIYVPEYVTYNNQNIIQNNISQDVIDNNNNNGYRYCAFVINKLTGSDSSLQITNINIYGVEKNVPSESVTQSTTIVTASTEYQNILTSLENNVKQAQQKALDADAEAVKKANIETSNTAKLKEYQDKKNYVDNLINDLGISEIEKDIQKKESEILTKQLSISKAQLEIDKNNTEKALYDAEQAKLEVIKAEIAQHEKQLIITIGNMGDLSNSYDSLVSQLSTLNQEHDDSLNTERIKLQSKMQEQLSAELRLNAEKTKEISDVLLELKEKYINQETASYLTELTSLAEIAKKNTQDAIDKKKQLNDSVKDTSNIYLDLQDEEIKHLLELQKKAEQLVVTENLERIAKADKDTLDVRKKHYEDLDKKLIEMKNNQDTNLNILQNTPYENMSLIIQIKNLPTETSNILIEEENKYNEFVNTQTQQMTTLSNDINILKETLDTISKDIYTHIQNTLSYRATTKRTKEEINKLSIEILQRRIELQKYKYTSNVLNIETSISDINTKITLHINNTAIYIANSIILSSLHKEYLDYSNKKDKIQAVEYNSTIDLEIQKRDNQIMIATIYLILNMLIATVIIFIIYGRRSLPFMTYILILIYIPFIIFYIIEIVKIVHTKASNKYWRKPEQNFV